MRIERREDRPAAQRQVRRVVTPESGDRSERFYTVRPDGGAITCHICGFASTDPHDVEQKFCPKCFVFHEDRILMFRLNEGYKTEFHALDQGWSHLRTAA